MARSDLRGGGSGVRKRQAARRGRSYAPLGPLCLTLVFLLVAATYAAPAASREHGRGHGAVRRSPIFQIERDLVDPLRDVVRSIERTIEPELRPEETRSRPRTPAPARPTAPREPTAAASDPEDVVAEPAPEAPREAATESLLVPPPRAPSIEVNEPVAPPPSTSRLALFALVLTGGAVSGALLLRQRRAPGELAAPLSIGGPASELDAAREELARDGTPSPDAGQRTTRPRLRVQGAIDAAREFVAAGALDLAIARLDEALAGPALLQAEPKLLAWYADLLSDADRPAEALVVLQALRLRDPGCGVATRIEELHKRANVAPALAANVAARPPGPSPFPSAGRYQILAELGRGGMGVVYQARDTRLDRMVALKRLSEHIRCHPRAVSLLLQEARSAARLNHPNIVTVYDVDHDEGAYFITMELMEGQPLNAVLQQRGRLTPKAAAWVGQHAAIGLAYAHERRIVHRDIKTANLFVTRERSLKIMDFGLAKMVEEVRRRASLIAGSPSYMAPEQARGLEVDGRADLYALGVTLFELLTGGLPFEAGDPAHHHQYTPPPDPRERVATVPDLFAELVVRLMAKQPACRPASASDVSAQLRALERDLSA